MTRTKFTGLPCEVTHCIRLAHANVHEIMRAHGYDTRQKSF